MSNKTAKVILDQIESTNLKHLMNDLIDYAIRYARIRTDWNRSNLNERRELYESRTRTHNIFIDSCNILSRNMQKSGEDNSWRNMLGDNRKIIGDFACYIHYILGLRSR